MGTTLVLAGVLREVGVIDRVKEATIYRLGVCVVGHWLRKPSKKGKRARDPWGYAPGHADELLDFERIMANTRSKEVAVHARDPLGNIVTPIPLGVTVRDFTQLALPYVLVEDDRMLGPGVGWKGWPTQAVCNNRRSDWCNTWWPSPAREVDVH